MDITPFISIMFNVIIPADNNVMKGKKLVVQNSTDCGALNSETQSHCLSIHGLEFIKCLICTMNVSRYKILSNMGYYLSNVKK